MPFISVSCTLIDEEVSLSGLDMAVGKNTDNIPIPISVPMKGSPLAFILIVPSVLLLIAGFVELPDIAAYIAYIAVAVVNYAIATGLTIILAGRINGNIFLGFLDSAIKINAKFGFVLYIALNAILFAVGIFSLAAVLRKSRGTPPPEIDFPS